MQRIHSFVFAWKSFQFEFLSNFVQITGMAPLDFDVVFVSGTNKQHAEVGSRVQNLSGIPFCSP